MNTDNLSRFDHVNELVRDIAHYFNRELTEKDKKQLAFYIGKFEQRLPEKIKVVEKVIKPLVPAKSSLDGIAFAICEEYDITIEQLKLNSPIYIYHQYKRKKTEYVNARQAFARRAIMIQGITIMMIADFLGYKEHSSIHHLIHHRKKARKRRKDFISVGE